MTTTFSEDEQSIVLSLKLLHVTCKRNPDISEESAANDDKEECTLRDCFVIKAHLIDWEGQHTNSSGNHSDGVKFFMAKKENAGKDFQVMMIDNEADDLELSVRKMDFPNEKNVYESLANSFLRVELLEIGNEGKKEEDVETKKIVGTASIDLGRCLVWPEKCLNRSHSIRLSSKDASFDLVDMTISLHVSDGCENALRRSRLFELKSAACEDISEIWKSPKSDADEDCTRYVLHLPHFSVGDQKDVVAVATYVDGSLQWESQTYPDDLCTFDSITVDLEAPPAFRAFVSDEAAISLRQHLKDNQSMCKALILKEEKRSKGEGDENSDALWKVVRRADVSMDLSALLRPGVATASCNSSVVDVVVKSESESDEGKALTCAVGESDEVSKENDEAEIRSMSAFFSLRFSHPLLGSAGILQESKTSGNFASNPILSVSQVFDRRKPRPKLSRLSEEEESILVLLRKDLVAVAKTIAEEYDRVDDVSRKSESDDELPSKTRRVAVAERLANGSRTDALRQRLLGSVVAIVRNRLKSASSKRIRREAICELNTFLMTEVDRCVGYILGISEMEAVRVKKTIKRDAQLSVLATEAEAFGAFQVAEEHHRDRLALDFSANASNGASAWEAYGCFCCRIGNLNDALACFEEALEIVDFSKASILIKKAAVQANLRDFDGCSRTIASLEVDKMGKDALTHEQGMIANVLLAVHHDTSGGRIRRDAAMKAAGNRYMLDKRTVFSESGSVKLSDAEVLFDPDELSRKLPRTVSALGGLIPRTFSHVKMMDVLLTYVQATFWFQSMGLFDVADKLLCMFREDLKKAIREPDSTERDKEVAVAIDGEIVEEISSSVDAVGDTQARELRRIAQVVEAKQHVASGNVARAEKLARDALSGGVKGYTRLSAARVLAECLRNSPAEERKYLELAIDTRRADCSKEEQNDANCLALSVEDDDSDRNVTVEDLRARFRLGLLYLASSEMLVESRRIFESIIRDFPSSVRAKVCLARACLQSGAIAEAESIACAIDCDDHPGAFVALALVDLARDPPNIGSAAKFTRMAMRRNLRDGPLVQFLVTAFSKSSEGSQRAKGILGALREL